MIRLFHELKADRLGIWAYPNGYMCKNANVVEKPCRISGGGLAACKLRSYIYPMLDTMPMNGTVANKVTDAPYTILPGSLTSGVLLLCDHADNGFPAGYDTLGVAPAQLQRHIAYDPGAAGITRHMSRLLGAPAVLTRYSRLLIDPNRGENDPTLIMRISDGAIVPGNAAISAGRAPKAYRPILPALSCRRRPDDRCDDRCREAAGHLLRPQLHRKLARLDASLACRRALGQGPEAGHSAAECASRG